MPILITTLLSGTAFGNVPVAAAFPPEAPQNLTSTSSTSSISLFWSAPTSDGGSPIIGYYIYRSTTSGGEVFYGYATNTAFTDPAPLVTPSTPYYYRVGAVNGIGEGALSNEIVRTLISPPSAPQNPSAVPGGGVVTLSATSPASDGGAPVNGYALYRGFTSGSEDFWGCCVTLPYYDTGVTAGTTYYYKFAASNLAGTGALSSEVRATPSAPAAPSAPRNLVATAGGGIVTLTWTPPASNGNSPLYYYYILRGLFSGGEASYWGASNVTTFIDNGWPSFLTPGTTYYYEVEAQNYAYQTGTVSNEANATPSSPAAPSPPLNLKATFTAGGIDLTWSAPASTGKSPIMEYNIFRGTTSGGETCCIAGSRDTYLLPGQTYYYEVSAVNWGYQESSRSGEANATAPSSTPPSAPQNLVASAGATDGVTKVTLSYNAPTSSGGWPLLQPNIFRGIVPSQEVLYVAGANLTYFIDPAVIAGSMYYYEVQYVNVKGTAGSFSSEVRVFVPSAPSAPQNLVATGSSGRISLSWSAPASNGFSPILGYYIYRGTGSGYETFYAFVVGTSYVDSGVGVASTHYYKVAAFSAGGFQSLPSSEANAKSTSFTTITPIMLLLAILTTSTTVALQRHRLKTSRPKVASSASG